MIIIGDVTLEQAYKMYENFDITIIVKNKLIYYEKEEVKK